MRTGAPRSIIEQDNSMRRLFAHVGMALLLVCPLPVGAQPPAAEVPPAQDAARASPAANLTEEQVKAEIGRLEELTRKHSDDPNAPAAWREYQKLCFEVEAFRERQQAGIGALEARFKDLRARDDVKKWIAEFERIQEQLNQLRFRDYYLAREAGRRLAESRHAELTKLAIQETPELDRLGLDVIRFPRLDGSTSTKPLSALIACRAFDMPYTWSGSRQRRLPRDDTFDLYADIERDVPYGREEPEVELLEYTLQAKVDDPATVRLGVIINRLLAANASTPQSYVNLIEGRSDFGLLARRPTAAELALAKKANVELEVTPCAWDAFVFIVHHENPVRNLSTAQIRDIYSGKVGDWKDVGGEAAAIVAFQREESSGSQELMRTLVMKELPFAKPKGEYAYVPNLVGYRMSGVFLELTDQPNGLAYSVYYYERFMSGSARTRTIAVDGVEPTYETIRDRKYPYATEVLMVTRKGIPADSPTARLRKWILSDEGQAVVRESGYVPLTLPKS
jgi:ABC-type phosphate transport system substrate-binding protein